MAPTDDFKLLRELLKPQWIQREDENRGRMWFKISFKVRAEFLPASFLVHLCGSGLMISEHHHLRESPCMVSA
jgi:hypothetical protein